MRAQAQQHDAAAPASEFVLAVQKDDDVVRVRQRARASSVECGFSLVDQTKFVTAGSELARNALLHGGGGECRIEPLSDGLRSGLRLTVRDHGPGIENIEQALTDGFSTVGGLGLGLGGARRLVDAFDIRSSVGSGTEVTIVRWSSSRGER